MVGAPAHLMKVTWRKSQVSLSCRGRSSPGPPKKTAYLVSGGPFPAFSQRMLSFEGGEPPPLCLAQRSLTLEPPQNPWIWESLVNYADFQASNESDSLDEGQDPKISVFASFLDNFPLLKISFFLLIN